MGEGPRKRVYRIGEKGKKGRETILLDAIVTAHRFYSEYLLTIPAKTNVLSGLCKPLSSNSARECQTSRTDLIDANVYKIVEDREQTEVTTKKMFEEKVRI